MTSTLCLGTRGSSLELRRGLLIISAYLLEEDNFELAAVHTGVVVVVVVY